MPLSFTDLYVLVQQFYAGQVRSLDGMLAAEFAATFAEDGVFDHAPGTTPLRGRAAITAEMRAYQERRYAADPCQRRHWFHMLQIFPGQDGTVRTEYYAVVMLTRPGVAEPVVAPSCLVRDVLEVDGDELLVRERVVRPDYAL